MGGFSEVLGINEFKTKRESIWKALLAEFVGNIILNYFGCASCMMIAPNVAKPNLVLIALSFGLSVLSLFRHWPYKWRTYNPAVTIAMLYQNISPLKAILYYVIVQCIGAIVGSGLLMASLPERYHDTKMGVTELSVPAGNGIIVEIMLGFILVFTVFGVVDINKHEVKPIAAFAIGVSVVIGHLATVDYTGSSMNPARTFGASVINNDWEDHWVYWVGPIIGGIIAGLLYKYVFAAPPTGPLKIIERYTAVVTDEKELQRLAGGKQDESMP
uniref:Aquaporin n=1 Tax=Pyrocoelia rufa TaxID=71223 RepID=Q95V87_PYRRU|nr:aquaporin [Pyrocoelia rufa]